MNAYVFLNKDNGFGCGEIKNIVDKLKKEGADNIGICTEKKICGEKGDWNEIIRNAPFDIKDIEKYDAAIFIDEKDEKDHNFKSVQEIYFNGEKAKAYDISAALASCFGVKTVHLTLNKENISLPHLKYEKVIPPKEIKLIFTDGEKRYIFGSDFLKMYDSMMYIIGRKEFLYKNN